MSEKKSFIMHMKSGETWEVPKCDMQPPDSMLNMAEQTCHNLYPEYKPKTWKNGKAIDE